MPGTMRHFAIAVALLALGGCGLTDGAAGPDVRAIATCADRHPPPPEANVERLGLIPVYYTRSADSDDAAIKQWYADMDACLGRPTPPASRDKGK